MKRQTETQWVACPPQLLFPRAVCVLACLPLQRSPLSVLPMSGFPHLSVTCVSQVESQTHTQAPSAFLDICCPLPRGPRHGGHTRPLALGLGSTKAGVPVQDTGQGLGHRNRSLASAGGEKASRQRDWQGSRQRELRGEAYSGDRRGYASGTLERAAGSLRVQMRWASSLRLLAVGSPQEVPECRERL